MTLHVGWESTPSLGGRWSNNWSFVFLQWIAWNHQQLVTSCLFCPEYIILFSDTYTPPIRAPLFLNQLILHISYYHHLHKIYMIHYDIHFVCWYLFTHRINIYFLLSVPISFGHVFSNRERRSVVELPVWRLSSSQLAVCFYPRNSIYSEDHPR